MGNFVNKHLMLILMFIIKEYLANEMDKYTTMLASGNPQVMIEVQSEIQKNYAKAEVFFQTLNVVNIVQTPLMDVSLKIFLLYFRLFNS